MNTGQSVIIQKPSCSALVKLIIFEYKTIEFMKALFFDGSLKLTELPDPVPAPGEALIRINYSSICNTDLEIIRGYMGFNGVPGHEFTGKVINPESAFFGKTVVGEINCPCGTCYLCRTGRRTHCSNRTVIGIAGHQGAFAEYIALPEENLHEVPEGLEETKAVFTEPLAAALEIFEQVKIDPSEPVLIFGTGKLGLLIAQVFHGKGLNYHLVGRNAHKVDLGLQLGLNTILLEKLSPEEKAEVCIDCTGNPEGILLAMDHLYPRGKLILKTTVAEPVKFDLNQVVINEFSIIGSRCGPFKPALELLARGQIKTEPMVSKVFHFNDIVEAFDYAGKPDVMKVLIRHG
jgi:threonine dehydrogenase-like Zn-dependent dehydrogenase